jgi:predicted transcriptional regulator
VSNAVLISIRPKWCELIASGHKTIEIRKTRPQIKTPFKCYIYCTKDNKTQFWIAKSYFYFDDHAHNAFDKCGNGTVIGEFVCDEIKTIDIPYPAYWTERHKRELDGSCLTLQQAHSYFGSACGYGWHISELKIYDKPKELSEFMQCHKCEYYSGCKEHEYGCNGAYKVTRPPQSFMYVEELP